MEQHRPRILNERPIAVKSKSVRGDATPATMAGMAEADRIPLHKDPKIATKWERFCRLRANGQSQGDAHLNCGYKKSHNKATHDNGGYLLEKRPQIRARIEELRMHADKVTEEMALVSKAEVMEKLRLNAEAATTAGQYQAVHASWKTYGGQIGMFTDKQEIHTFDHKIEGMPQEDLMAYVIGMTNEIGSRPKLIFGTSSAALIEQRWLLCSPIQTAPSFACK